MVGGGTARDDDPPSLTVRGLGVTRQPVRVVLSRHLDLPLDSQLARTAREIPVWLCHSGRADPGLVSAWQGMGGAETLEVGVAQGQLDPVSALQALGGAKGGLTRVFCEGGGGLAASLLNAGLVDELIGFAAGIALGGAEGGRPSLAAMGVDRLAEAPPGSRWLKRATWGG